MFKAEKTYLVWLVYVFSCTLGTMQPSSPQVTNLHNWLYGYSAPMQECLNEATLIGPAAHSAQGYTIEYLCTVLLYSLHVSLYYEWCPPPKVVNPPTRCGHG